MTEDVINHSLILIAVMAIITLLLRALPFLIFGGKKKTPSFITYLGKVLPFATMGMLVVYCLKSVNVLSWPHGLPELICIVLVAALHAWKRNTLISIVAGTAAYMLLVQLVF